MTTRNGNNFESGTGRIVGVVAAVPKNRRPTEGWPMAEEAAKVTGILERRVATDLESTESLCCDAARELLASIGWAASTFTALVYVTQTPAMQMPASGFDLHRVLGLHQACDVVTVNYACSGYVKGLKLAQKLATREGARVLLLVGDTTSKECDPADRATAPVFGDAATATAIEYDPTGCDFFITGCDGVDNSRLSQHGADFMHMDGGAVFNFTLKRVPQLVEDLRNLTPFPDLVLFHQANKFMLDHLVKKCRLLDDFEPWQIPTNVERFGNCSSASIPLLLADWWQQNPSARDTAKRAAMIGFGAGWSWGAASVNLSGLVLARVIEV